MTKHPTPRSPAGPSSDPGRRSASTDSGVNPDREYEDATETKLDHSKPPSHRRGEQSAADQKHADGPQISVGKP